MKKLLIAIQFLLFIIIIITLNNIMKYKNNSNKTDLIMNETIKLVEELQEQKDLLNQTNLEQLSNEKIIKEYEEKNINYLNKMFMQKIKDKYPDTVAYIQINNTNISYPIVQTIDNNFYLKHSPDKKYNSNGSIFMSYLNSNDFSDDNTIIYGHNLKNGKLFNNLHLFKNQDFYNKTNEIIIQTEEQTKKYMIFSVYIANPEEQYKTPNFNNDFDKMSFIKKRIELSIIDNNNIEINANDKIITLSTCEAAGKKRLVIHGVELKED